MVLTPPIVPMLAESRRGLLPDGAQGHAATRRAGPLRLGYDMRRQPFGRTLETGP
ncbi:hypothetical protein ABZZ74_48330 [Streptomyces sp. NPDC006476]|uniref:hypothetical protein n=1 Tax=Streptomyces sp. NPDC006476 TaxID=3157175 RepID=UPI0033B708C7